MKCPYCGHRRTGIHRTEMQEDGLNRRYRVCMSCAASFTTIETPVVFTGDGYTKLEVKEPPLPSTNYRTLVLPSDHWGLPSQLANDVAYWWQVARWGKHGSKAVWTQRAFQASLRRVQQLHAVDAARAEELVQQGIERGWQSLDPKFLSPTRPAPAVAGVRSGVRPNSPAMQSALERWNEPL